MIWLPKSDVESAGKVVLEVNGAQMRCETIGTLFESRVGDFVADRRRVEVDDGISRWTLTDEDETRPMQLHATGFIKRADASGALGQLLHLRAVLLWCRPFQCLDESLNISNYSLSPTVTRVEGRDCVVLTRGGDNDSSNVFWLDCDRDYVPTRWRSHVQGEVRIEMTMEYKQDVENKQWLPIRWKTVVYQHSDEQVTSKTRVGNVSFSESACVELGELNPEISGSRFKPIAFPPRCYVANERDNEYFIVREDGTKRVVSEGEMAIGLSYEELLKGDTSAGVVRRITPAAVALIVICGVAVFGLCAFLVKRRASKRGDAGVQRPARER